MAHLQKHDLFATSDHYSSVSAQTGGQIALTIDDQGALGSKAIGTAAGNLPAYDANGQLYVPAMPQADNDAASKKYVEDLIAAGIWKSNTAAVVPNHAAATVTGLAVGKHVVDTTDKKVYTVTSVAGGTTGDTVTYDSGYLPTTPEIRVAEDTDKTWVFDVEGSSWIDTGSSNHSRLHAMTSTADHSAGTNKVFYSDGNGEVQELALGNQGTVLKSGGTGAAPTFGTLAIADLVNGVVTGSGAEPAAADFAGDADNTVRFVLGTNGNLFLAIKTSTGVKSVELS